MKIKITGMSCEHCKSRVELAIKNLGYKAEVNLPKGEAEVQAEEAKRSEIIKAVEDVGFDAE